MGFWLFLDLDLARNDHYKRVALHIFVSIEVAKENSSFLIRINGYLHRLQGPAKRLMLELRIPGK